MSTIAEFRLFVLDSLKYSSKAESPINRSTKAVISRNLTTSRQNHLFIYLFICLFINFFFNFLFYFSYIYRKQALPSYLHSDSNRCYWLAWMNKKYLFITWEIKFSNLYIYIHIYMYTLYIYIYIYICIHIYMHTYIYSMM